jgi:hypothetical protein
MTQQGIIDLANETGNNVVIYHDRTFAVEGSIKAEWLEERGRRPVGLVRPGGCVQDMMGVARSVN